MYAAIADDHGGQFAQSEKTKGPRRSRKCLKRLKHRGTEDAEEEEGKMEFLE